MVEIISPSTAIFKLHLLTIRRSSSNQYVSSEKIWKQRKEVELRGIGSKRVEKKIGSL